MVRWPSGGAQPAGSAQQRAAPAAAVLDGAQAFADLYGTSAG